MKKGNGEALIPGNAQCTQTLKSVVDALYVLGGKWTLPIVLSVMQGSKRFNELLSEVPGISPKMLAKELKDLELNEFIRRTVLPTSPQTILYEATPYSGTLKEVLDALGKWGAQHKEIIRRSMRRETATRANSA